MKALCVLIMAIVLGTAAQAQTYTESILYNFGASTSDGVFPEGGLVTDAKANLYGTTYVGGGAADAGTVFKLDDKGVESILHVFTGPDGAAPGATLSIDKSGNLYGTTSLGGLYSQGTVFEITAAGDFTTLYNFGSVAGDGAIPMGSLTRDAAGNLYGTTFSGGTSNSECANSDTCGTIFKLSPGGVETILYKFAGGPNDGGKPTANVVRDGLGNIFGTTSQGGTHGFGVFFELTLDNVESVIYNFCPDGPDCAAGGNPEYILEAKPGDFYGNVATAGDIGAGGVFEISSNSESLLYDFCSCLSGPYPNGFFPTGPLLMSGGNIYGTTVYGGKSSTTRNAGGGVVYEITTSGVETVLYNFPHRPGDGQIPNGGILMDKAGNLYGTTSRGGTYGEGTVFKLTKH